ncbi:MAG: hypothetical protein P1U34_08095 [Coxiellaceae bacterium]|nr:hypothetical protein [Coxiellaceae bacterium]
MNIMKVVAVVSCISLPVLGFALSGEPYGKTNVGDKQIGVEFVGKNSQNKLVTKPMGTQPNTMKKTQNVQVTTTPNAVNTKSISVDFVGKPKPAP